MRLTLRTLLAYLDDTLDPAQTKLIGQKVAESDTAQELVARIKQVTRRRRLTTPQEAGAAGKIDPNTIAEYLDNVVTAEQQADIEQICLASDVHLAEVAACHQILTLVLGEPALVPPPAKQRMYGLVKGPEAIPYRKPPTRTEREHEAVEEKETDETLRLGLPAYGRKTGWPQRVLLIGGVAVAAALLVYAILQVMNPPGPANTAGPVIAQNTQTGKDKEIHEPPINKKEGPGAADKNGKEPDKKGAADAKGGKPEQKQKDKPPADKNKETKPPETGAPTKVPYEKPSTRQVLVGDYVPPSTKEVSVLLQSQIDSSEWVRIGVKKPEVYSARPLVSLPGCRSVVQTKGGVRLTLWGYLPELSTAVPIMESLVELHHSEQPLIDLDLTLRRGRIVLLNMREKGPARVRVRFENPTNPDSGDFFDITLQERNSEILIDRWSFFSFSERFFRNPKDAQRLGPVAQMGLIMLAGDAYLRFNDVSSRLESPSATVWNSVKGDLAGPERLSKVPDFISTNPPVLGNYSEEERKNVLRARAEMLRARDELATEMSVKQVGVALKEAVTAPKDPAKRTLAVRCFGAIDDLSSLVDALDQDNFPDVRHAAVQVLQTWIASSRDAEYRLYAFLQNKYKLQEAATIMDLLHITYYSPQAVKDPVTYDTLIGYLGNDLMPIRELAAWHLYRLVPAARARIPFSATVPAITRRQIQEEWRKLIPPGKLPPSSMTK